MAIIDLQHTVQKFVQVTQQSFMADFESVAKTKDFANVGKFKAQLRQTAENIYNGAKYSGLDNEEALKQLEEAQKKLINSYTDEYRQLLKNHNQSTSENATLPAEQKKAEKIKNNGYDKVVNTGSNSINSGIDIDPEVVQTGADEKDPASYATFFNGQRMGKNISSYAGTNNTYSMCDMVCQIDIVSNTGKHVVATLGKLQTLSYSIFQNKAPVRVIGNMNARDYIYGQRTIAGSLIFAVFNKHWLIDLYDKIHDTEGMKNWHFIADEIPPFNITISFANEYGYDSRMAIYGVRLVNEGQTMSINDIYIENTYEYVATDIEILDSLNAWQSSDKLSRRYNVAGAIASSTPQQSGNNILNMKGNNIGQNNEENNNIKTVIISIPDTIIDISKERLKNSTKEEMWAALKKAYDKLEDEIDAKVKTLKEGKTKEEQQKIDEEADNVRQKLGQIYNRQYEEIREYYNKNESIKAENKIESKSVETSNGTIQGYTVRITGQSLEKAKELGRIKAKQLNNNKDPEIISEGYNEKTKQYILVFKKTG